VRIGIPILHGRVSPLLDTASRLLVLTCKDGRESSRQQLALEMQSPESLARTLTEMQLDLVICAAISMPLLRALQREKQAVRHHLCGEVEAILLALCHGQLGKPEFRMPGCHEEHRVPFDPHADNRSG